MSHALAKKMEPFVEGMGLVDAHCHIQFDGTLTRLDGVLDRAVQQNVHAMVVSATHEGDWDRVALLASTHPIQLRCAFGIHPWWADSVEAGWCERLEALLVQHPEASVGEIGLDGSRKGAHVVHDVQNAVFVAQLHLAKRMKRPVSVHCVRRYGRVLEGLRKANKTHNEGSPVAPWCLLHGYNGPVEMIGQFVRAGAVFSFGLSLTHTPSPKQIAAVRAVPLNALLLETDSPDNRSCTEPADMAAVAKCVAEVRDMSENELKALVWDTSVAFFGIATEHDEV